MISSLTVYTDGGARGNPGPAAIGIVICTDDDHILYERSERIGRATNNEAEYRAVIRGLELAAGYAPREVLCVADSELIVRQLTGRYRVRNPRMEELFLAVKKNERPFEKVRYEQRPRLTGHLRRADELVNEALDAAGR